MKRTIIEENKKPLRQAFTTVIGIVDKQRDYLMAGFEPNAYNEPRFGSQDEEEIPNDNRMFMDLSGEGFLNNGEAEPLDNGDMTYKGAIAPSAAMKYWDIVLVNLPNPVPDNTSVTIHYYQNGTLYRHKGKTAGGNGAVRLVPHSTKDRIYVASIIIGDAYYWDNRSIIDCSLNLRGIETRLEEPELQLSEIRFEVLKGDIDWRTRIATIADGIPIEYATGYPGNMSRIRRFYLSTDESEVGDSTVNFKGYDATSRLEGDYPGRALGSLSSFTGEGYLAIFNEIKRILTNAGITVYADSSSWDNLYDVRHSEPLFIPNGMSKRKMIANMVNVSNFEYWNQGKDKWVTIMYTDAGRPKLFTNRSFTPVEDIEEPSDMLIVPERRINRIEIDNPLVDYGPRITIEKYDNTGKTVRTLDKPYASLQASKGTISQINPYTFTLQGSGEIEVTGLPIRWYDPSEPAGAFTPRVFTRTGAGRTAVLAPIIGMEANLGDKPDVTDAWGSVLDSLINRSNELFKFRWRGNPELQPRDIIRVEVDGQLTTMTIESIECSHKDGGYQQSIVARGGIV